MWKRPVSRIMILRMDNSSISCSFATKYFLCAAVKKNMLFWREILFHQSSHRYLTYSYLMIFHKVVTKAKEESVLSKDFLRLFLVWNESIIHFGILLNKNGDIVPPLIKNFEVPSSASKKGFNFFK